MWRHLTSPSPPFYVKQCNMDIITVIFLGILFLPVFLALWIRRSNTIRTHLDRSDVPAAYWGVYEEAKHAKPDVAQANATVALPNRIALPDDGHEKERNFSIHYPDMVI